MAHPILMPKAGQSMTEGTIVSWFKKEGDTVERGQPLLEIETDKANLDVESTEAGVLRKVFHTDGDVVPVLEVIAIIGTADEEIDFEAVRQENAPAVEETPATSPRRAAAKPPAPSSGKPKPARAVPTAAPTATMPAVATATVSLGATPLSFAPLPPVARTTSGKRVAASPLARRIASERGVDLRSLKGSGPGGRIVRRDVESAPTTSSSNGHAATVGLAPAIPYPPPSPQPPETIALDGMRGAIAKALQQSKSTIPHFYMTMAIDMSTALGVKASLGQSGVRVTVNDLILRASTLALIDEPKVNCRVFDDHVEYPKDVNIGVAVGNDDGLVVPVILGAQQHDLAGLADASREVIENAQNGKLVGTGQGTFTVSNLGTWGVESFTAIINPPEGAILAVGGIHQEIVPAGGGFFPRSMLRVSLSCDHRAIDGLIAARFLARLKHLLESGRIG
jgi:pyruvate dehydrogenase E2 component (dihydrolipoamide acetyltransferase)